MSPALPSAPPRVVGVDVARALASLIMVQGHAYHAWVAEPYRASASYGFTRLLGTLPLPAFLLLAGASLGLRLRVAVRRGEAASAVRAGLVRRGAMLVLTGYAVNALFALLDGAQGLDTLLRVDVLHVIGLSLASLAWLGVRGTGPLAAPAPRHFRIAATGLLIVPALSCPWLSPLGASVPRWLSPLAALLVDVPGITRMPWVPLVSWLAAGALCTSSQRLLPLGQQSPFELSAGTPWPRALALCVGAVALAIGASLATDALVAWSGQPLSRAHPAVVLNVIDLGARGAVVLAGGLLISGALPPGTRPLLAEVGQSSLWIYVAHLPFCYGRAGKALFHRLDMLEATGWLLPLLTASVLLGVLRARFRNGVRKTRPMTLT